MNNGEEEADKLVSILTDHRTSGQSKRQKKHEIQLSYSKSIHLHNSLLHEVKSLEGFKMGLKVCMGDPSTQSYNIELVVSKQDFGRGYKPSCSRRVFDLAAGWFLLSEAWNIGDASLTGH